MALFLYFSLLVFWIALIPPGWRLSGGPRLIVFMAVGIGLVAAIYEALMIFVIMPGMSGPIRVDILLIVPTLWGVYTVAVGVLVWVRRTKGTITLAVLLALIGFGVAGQWITMNRYTDNLRATNQERTTLLFEAKFRSLDAYHSYFGAFDGQNPESPAAQLVGHWEGPGDSYFTRLIVNAEGDAWLFYLCDASKCHYRTKEARLSPGENGSWRANLSAYAIQDLPISITAEGIGRLSVDLGERRFSFTKALPPIDPSPAPEALTYLGPFSAHSCRRQHADVRQVWLWQEGARLYALGVFAPLVGGTTARFISPVIMGVSESEGGTWRFEWDTDDWRSGSAQITLTDQGADLLLEQKNRPAVEISLTRGAIIEDESITLASRTNGQDWQHWFDVAFVGHFVSGDIPACEAAD